ncbi:hypothetical protein B0H11DRAFT_2231789 [Mycena galericulata]|nr:hypothetical protein B0H11DRAFT_2231789 [Mycena galericulata]
MSLSRALPDGTPLLLDARGHLVETGPTMDSQQRRTIVNEATLAHTQTQAAETAAVALGSAWRPDFTRGARSAATPVSTCERVDRNRFDSLLMEERVAARRQEKTEAEESRLPLSAAARATRLAELLDLAVHIAHARFRRLYFASSAATRIRRPEDVQRATEGRRTPLESPLTRENLFLTPERPPDLPECKLHHQCGICRGPKSHPVSYLCGHSHCYVCIRTWLERSWCCPICMTPMYIAPVRHYGEEDGIAADYPDWQDKSTVDYSWDGLVWPKRPPRRIVESPSP